MELLQLILHGGITGYCVSTILTILMISTGSFDVNFWNGVDCIARRIFQVFGLCYLIYIIWILFSAEFIINIILNSVIVISLILNLLIVKIKSLWRLFSSLLLLILIWIDKGTVALASLGREYVGKEIMDQGINFGISVIIFFCLTLLLNLIYTRTKL